MVAAEVAAGLFILINGRLIAEQAPGRAFWEITAGQASSPMGDPDDPDLVGAPNTGILRYQRPVPGDKDLDRIEPEVSQEFINRGRCVIDIPCAPVGQDKFHVLRSTVRGCFLMMRVIRPEAGEEQKALRLAVPAN
jgi:hypothetical protein